MAFAYLLAFVLPGLWACCNVIDQKISHQMRFRISSILVINALLIICFYLPVFYAIFRPAAFPAEHAAVIITYGLLDTLYLVPYYIALRHISTSVVGALFKMGAVVVAIESYIFLGEELMPVQYVGFAIVVAASLYASYHKGDENAPRKLSIAFWLMLLAAFVTSSNAVLGKYATTIMPWHTMYFWSQLTAALLVLTILVAPAVRRHLLSDLKRHPEMKRYAMTEQFFATLAEGGMFFVMAHIPVTIMKAIAALQPVYLLLFARLFHRRMPGLFHEDLRPKEVERKMVSFAFIGVGLFVIFVVSTFWR
ncbi:MAG: hypothetical protein AB7G06_03615 [Bdellovibrionales bacterium]